MNDRFMVDHICITCDRIAKLKLTVFSPICYVIESFCCRIVPNFCDIMNIDSILVDILHPTKVTLPMLDCCTNSKIESDFHINCVCPNTCCIYMLLMYTSLIFAN